MSYCEFESALTEPLARERFLPVVNVAGRSAALKMYLGDEALPKVIARVPHLDERGFWRIWETTRRSDVEETIPAVGMVIMHPVTGEILVHQERFADVAYFKFEGSHSVQLTWQGRETTQEALDRLLRQEVFGASFLKPDQLKKLVIPLEGESVLRVMVADALVDVRVMMMTELGLNWAYRSGRVENIHWEAAGVFLERKMRAGVREMVEFVVGEYWPHQYRDRGVRLSQLNEQVAAYR